MEKITSTSNELIKNVSKLSQKKYRDEKKLFLAEGEKAIDGLSSSGFKINMIFVNGENYSGYGENKVYLVNDAVMSKISTTKSPCTVVAVAEQKNYNLKEFLSKTRLVLLENIKDAGNLGTILRACKAFNIEGILLLGDTIDLYNPKVVRASVGCFDIPVINITYENLKEFKNHTVYSTALYDTSVPLSAVKFDKNFIIAFGSEADGLSAEFMNNKTKNIIIEMSSAVESLNLASAVSICLYQIYKSL